MKKNEADQTWQENEDTFSTPTQKVKEIPPFLLRLEVGEVGTVGFAQGGGVAILELEIAAPYLCSSFFKSSTSGTALRSRR